MSLFQRGAASNWISCAGIVAIDVANAKAYAWVTVLVMNEAVTMGTATAAVLAYGNGARGKGSWFRLGNGVAKIAFGHASSIVATATQAASHGIGVPDTLVVPTDVGWRPPPAWARVNAWRAVLWGDTYPTTAIKTRIVVVSNGLALRMPVRI
jgi:hypothetical protein